MLRIKSFYYTVGTLWNIIIRYSGYNFGFLDSAAAKRGNRKKGVKGKAVAFHPTKAYMWEVEIWSHSFPNS